MPAFLTGLRLVALATFVALFAGVLGPVPGQAGHSEDDHSDNFVQLTNKPIKIGKELLGRS